MPHACHSSDRAALTAGRCRRLSRSVRGGGGGPARLTAVLRADGADPCDGFSVELKGHACGSLVVQNRASTKFSKGSATKVVASDVLFSPALRVRPCRRKGHHMRISKEETWFYFRQS
ncbi:uncharacterized protein LOC144590574 [Rhinoraja longicauda]